MYTVNFHVKQTGDAYWIYMQKSPGDLDKGDPLHTVLTWIIEQLNFAMFRTETDEEGEACTMIIGERASLSFRSMAEAEKHGSDRLLGVNIAEVLAKAREEGTQQEHVDLIEKATVTRTGWAELKTEFHYARELVKVLKRLREVTFDFSPPGILGRATEEVVFYLRQATRCFMYGLYESSVALCRACLEEALKAKPYASGQGIEALMKEPKKTEGGRTRGELERLISAAAGVMILDGPSKMLAHRIRDHGNTVMHDRPLLKESEAKQDLDDLRTVVHSLFAS
jgi:hypothetical protein